jgi:hypothetical protein
MKIESVGRGVVGGRSAETERLGYGDDVFFLVGWGGYCGGKEK